MCGAQAGWIKLLELACSAKARLRCVALYGLMKHFGYIGPYDPFETGQTLARMAAGLKIAVERHR